MAMLRALLGGSAGACPPGRAQLLLQTRGAVYNLQSQAQVHGRVHTYVHTHAFSSQDCMRVVCQQVS